MMQYKKVLGALTIVSALATGSTAFAQTASTTTGTSATTDTSVTSPAAPNTGEGGNAAENYALLGGSAVVFAAGAAYLARKKATA